MEQEVRLPLIERLRACAALTGSVRCFAMRIYLCFDLHDCLILYCFSHHACSVLPFSFLLQSAARGYLARKDFDKLLSVVGMS